jgi:hypothetical protein
VWERLSPLLDTGHVGQKSAEFTGIFQMPVYVVRQPS